MRTILALIICISTFSSYACDCMEYEANFFKNAINNYNVTTLIKVDTVLTQEYGAKYTQAILLEEWKETNYQLGDTLWIEGQNGANCGDNMLYSSGDTLVISTGSSIDYLSGDCGLHYLSIENGKANGLTIDQIKTKIESGDWRIYSDFWKPFLSQTTAVFSFEKEGSTQYEQITAGTIIEGFFTEDTLLLNNINTQCGNSIIDRFYSDSYQIYTPHKISIDANNKITYSDPSNEKQFIFKPFASLEETWQFNEMTFSYDSAGVAIILDTLDSVKYYTLVQENVSYQFILSKHFGWYQWHNFVAFTYDNATAQDKSQTYQLHAQYTPQSQASAHNFPFKMEDFFHLNTGDIRIWEIENNSWEYPNSIFYYYRDSILAAVHTNDSVNYVFERVVKDSVGNIDTTMQMKETHYRQDYENILQATTSQNFIGFNIAFDSNAVLYKSALREGELGIEFDIYTTAEIIYDCSSVWIADLDEFYGLSTDFGLSKKGYHSWGTYREKVIGGKINGQVYGTPSVVTANNLVYNQQVHVYPNPSAGLFRIQFDTYTDKTLEVYNNAGKLIQKQNTSGLQGVLKIETKGIYLLKIREGKNTTVQKIIVIN